MTCLNILERLGAQECAAVDVYRGRRPDAEPIAICVDVHHLGELSGVEALVELGGVERERAAWRLKPGIHLLLGGEHPIVHLQHLPCLAGAVRGLGRLRRRGVIREREVLKTSRTLSP